MFRVIVAYALASFVMLAATAAVRADETFVCEDGSQVTVLTGQLELMKRTDPCVARHFGLALEPQQPAAPVPSWAPIEAPLPDRKPNIAVAGFAAEGQAQGPLGEGGAVDGSPTVKEEVKSDYRHVHIINASPGASKFYQHTR